MYKKSAQQLDQSLNSALAHYNELVLYHKKVVEDYVSDYREMRQSEISLYRSKLANNEPAIKPCLLALVVRKKPITSCKNYAGYFKSGESPYVWIINLAKISGSYTEHISQTTKSGEYASKRVANMRGLRISTPAQKSWVIDVIDQANELNFVGEKLKNQYVEVLKMHYNSHRFLTTLKGSPIENV